MYEPQDDRPAKRQKPSPTAAHGQTTHQVEQDGYGKHMHPTTSTVPIPIKTSHVHGEIKRSMWINLSFCEAGPCSMVIPYHLLQFWIGLDEQENNTLRTFNLLSAAAYGITWHEFNLSIYNQATTRKRLLTQGSTTYETNDFETSQNLMILTDVNQSHTPSILWPDDFMPPGSKYRTADLQSGTYFCKTEELATGHTKTFSFNPEKLPSSYVWELIHIDKSGSHSDKMFPARQHTTSHQSNDIPLVAISKGSFTSMHIQWKPQPMPLIVLDAPHILSETGNMKFIYRTRWDFSIPYTFHMMPSAAAELSYNKFVTPYPKAKITPSGDEARVSLSYIATPTLL
jgi:hypothetical protein